MKIVEKNNETFRNAHAHVGVIHINRCSCHFATFRILMQSNDPIAVRWKHSQCQNQECSERTAISVNVNKTPTGVREWVSVLWMAISLLALFYYLRFFSSFCCSHTLIVRTNERASECKSLNERRMNKILLVYKIAPDKSGVVK